VHRMPAVFERPRQTQSKREHRRRPRQPRNVSAWRTGMEGCNRRRCHGISTLRDCTGLCRGRKVSCSNKDLYDGWFRLSLSRTDTHEAHSTGWGTAGRRRINNICMARAAENVPVAFTCNAVGERISRNVALNCDASYV
jgi:hypothetical protein